MNENAKFSGYFKLVNIEPTPTQLQDNITFDTMSMSTVTGWYNNIVTGSGNRLSRYAEYDLMDSDVDVSRALDIIAEEMTNENDGETLSVELETDVVDEIGQVTLNTALRRWCKMIGLEAKLFDIARHLIKYGDVVFNKVDTFSPWEYVPIKNVSGAYVDQNNASLIIGLVVNQNFKSTVPKTLGVNSNTLEITPMSKLVRFTLNNGMSESAPFGLSILNSVYRAYQQKKLIEDSIIIYRVQRAPEKRVFYIDVGKMPPPRRKAYLEQVKLEMRQKKIPTVNNSSDSGIDNMYDPQDMMEDFFLATSGEGGRGSKIEVLPGGANLGELSDLNHFSDKLAQGLRIPVSWTRDGTNGPTVTNDGKVGAAFIQEARFAKFTERLQTALQITIDAEFKAFVKSVGIKIDPHYFSVVLPKPSNFDSYRQAEKDAALLNLLSQTSTVATLSPRFAARRYLQMTQNEIIENERMLREERGIALDDPQLITKLYSPDSVVAGDSEAPADSIELDAA
jgi:hypothetical protein